MRKLVVLVALGALVAGPAALAKERNVTMFGAPLAPKAGQGWNVTISVKVDGKLVPTPGMAPVVRIINGVRSLNVQSTPTAAPGVYKARVVFPKAGMWRVLVVDRVTGRAYEFHRMRVQAT
jgi:hypothetical protein